MSKCMKDTDKEPREIDRVVNVLSITIGACKGSKCLCRSEGSKCLHQRGVKLLCQAFVNWEDLTRPTNLYSVLDGFNTESTQEESLNSSGLLKENT